MDAAAVLPETTASFHDSFVGLFNAEFPRLYRYLDRLSGEPELAADLAQEAFVRLYRRGALPELPVPWLFTVAMNLLRNDRSARSRRGRLLSVTRAAAAHSDPPPAPDQVAVAQEERQRVRRALDRIPEREQRMLLLRAGGFSYHEIAAALKLHEASVGTLLARARKAFRATYEDGSDAS